MEGKFGRIHYKTLKYVMICENMSRNSLINGVLGFNPFRKKVKDYRSKFRVMTSSTDGWVVMMRRKGLR